MYKCILVAITITFNNYATCVCIYVNVLQLQAILIETEWWVGGVAFGKWYCGLRTEIATKLSRSAGWGRADCR
jgi:hypothetical protein